MARADTVFWLDYSRFVCLFRVVKRQLKIGGVKRADLAEGCNEKLDLEFLNFVRRFPYDSRPQIKESFDNFCEKGKGYRFEKGRCGDSILEQTRQRWLKTTQEII